MVGEGDRTGVSCAGAVKNQDGFTGSVPWLRSSCSKRGDRREEECSSVGGTVQSLRGEAMVMRRWRSALAPYLARQMSESGLS